MKAPWITGLRMRHTLLLLCAVVLVRCDCRGVAVGHPASCGNGTVEKGEACDDGHRNSDEWSLSPHCNSECTGFAPHCGDGVTDPLEICDDGHDNGSYDHCRTDCSGLGSHCGDGTVDSDHEACEPGIVEDPCDACALDCSGLTGTSVCGDGVICAANEVCDDRFQDECGTCNATCSGFGTGPGECGDGAWCPEVEVCDDGFTDACGTCNATCTGPGTGPGVCGDGGWCREFEECDDGFVDTCGDCNTDCTDVGTGWECGDGETCPQYEACDDGFRDACGTCNADCSGPGTGPGACGDGDWCREFEACDDGWQDSCGSCNESCTAEGTGPGECGDGEWCPQHEYCDDGYEDACGSCNATCTGDGTGATCGDGETCPELEACDDGADNGTRSSERAYCTPDCQGTQLCGNGAQEGSEACDDGNTDDCTGDCLGDCSAIVSITGCGDGVLCPPEECDDEQNGEACDGCLDDCTVVSVAPGPTVAPAVVDTQTTWYPMQSPVVLTGGVVVLDGVTLKVCAGTTIEATAGVDAALWVRGTVQVDGTAAQPVVFTSDGSPPATGDWRGIRIQRENGVASIEGAVVEFATEGFAIEHEGLDAGPWTFRESTFRDNDIAFSFGSTAIGSGELSVEDTQILNNRIGFNNAMKTVCQRCVISGSEYAVFDSDDVSLLDCEITENDVGVLAGVHSRCCEEVVVERCLIADNVGAGVVAVKSGLRLVNNTIVRNSTGIRSEIDTFNAPCETGGNTLCNNDGYDVELATTHDLEAASNWWCTTDAEVIPGRIRDVYDDPSLGLVTFGPVLSGPAPDAPFW